MVSKIAKGMDRNTAYYHRSAMIRRNRNKIGSLKIEGEWCSDPKTLKNHVRDYYDKLFDVTSMTSTTGQPSPCQLRMDDTAHRQLLAPASVSEVKKVCFR